MNFFELKSGRSVEKAKIESYKVEGRFSKYIYLIGGVHGDEVEGVFLVKKIFDWLKEIEDFEIPMLVVPVLNVDGYRVQTRVNSHGVDLNRNLPSKGWSNEFEQKKYYPGKNALSEPENNYLVKLFDKFRPGIIISIHSWKPMLNINGDCEGIAQFLNKYNHYSVEEDVGYKTPGSLGEFAPEKYNCPVLTYELPKINDDLLLKDIWEQNRSALQELFRSDLLKQYL